MKHAFVSHASNDYEVAKSVCRMLEKRGIECWIAPDDLTAGRSYGIEIIRGIEQTAVTILLLSRHANASKFVSKEIERAVSKDKPVLPVRLEDVQPSPDLELFISGNHWIDVWPSLRDATLDRLAAAIRDSIAASPQTSDGGPVKPEPLKPPPPSPNRRRRAIVLTGASIAVATIAGIGYLRMSPPSQLMPATTPSASNMTPTPAPTASLPAPEPGPVAEQAPQQASAAAKPTPEATPAVAPAAQAATPRIEAPKPQKKTSTKIAGAAQHDAHSASQQPAKSRNPQCAQILQRASLGEPLSRDDNTLLRTQC